MKKEANIRIRKSYSNIRIECEYSNIRIFVDILILNPNFYMSAYKNHATKVQTFNKETRKISFHAVITKTIILIFDFFFRKFYAF